MGTKGVEGEAEASDGGRGVCDVEGEDVEVRAEGDAAGEAVLGAGRGGGAKPERFRVSSYGMKRTEAAGSSPPLPISRPGCEGGRGLRGERG